MKKLLSILLMTLVLLLVFILMNSNSELDMLYPEPSMSLTQGVDFSNVQHGGRSSSFGRGGQASLGTSLMSNKQGLLSSKNDLLSENLYSYLPEANSFERGKTPVASTSNQLTTGSGSAIYGGGLRPITEHLSTGGLGSSAMIAFGGSRRIQSSSQGGASTGISVGGSGLFGGIGRAGAPPNPATDYFENDITHPGGNPMGDPIENGVPVGSGALPFILFISAYILKLYKKK